MKKNILEAMNEYSDAEKQPEKDFKKFVPERIGKKENIHEHYFHDSDNEDEDPNEKNSIMSGNAGNKPGLWENIQRKKDREGKNYKPAKPGDPDRPDPDAFKKAQK